MSRRAGQRKKRLSERAAAAQAAQAAVAAAAATRGRGRETKKAREARRSAEKVLRTHGVEPVAAADDPAGFARVEQLAALNLRLHTAQQTGPAAAEQYRMPTPSPFQARRQCGSSRLRLGSRSLQSRRCCDRSRCRAARSTTQSVRNEAGAGEPVAVVR
jgi:hypothetical protein